jgi:diamine N-acetyltransferase
MSFPADVVALEDCNGATLRPVTVDDASQLGVACARLDPWRTYGTTAAELTALCMPAADTSCRLTVCDAAGACAGITIVRWPWLNGPYVQFLAILPEHQGRGLGRAILAHIEQVARTRGQRNLWICVSHFNLGAQALYTRHGFDHAATLPGLVHDDVDELLLRKRLS